MALKSLEYALRELKDRVHATTPLNEPVALLQEILEKVKEGGDIDALIDRSIAGAITSNVETVGDYAFKNCQYLTETEFPNATSVGVHAFYGNSSFESIDAPNVTTIGEGAFYNCPLTEVSFPNVVDIYNVAFSLCSGLTSVYAPNAITIRAGAFSSCGSLTSLTLTSAETISSSAFSSCSSLITIDLPSATSIGDEAFAGCSNLTAVILGTRAANDGTLTFNNSDNAIVYVNPDDLTWYSQQTNWASLYNAGRIKSVEELPSN